MFVMVEDPQFNKKVTGNEPGDDGNAFSFGARFIALGATEQKTFDLGTEDGTAAFLRRTLVGWDHELLSANKEPIPFSVEVRDWLIDKAHTRSALVQAYFRGVYEGVLGNSGPPPSAGHEAVPAT